MPSPKRPTTPPPCQLCGAPSIERPRKPAVLCAKCAAIAQDIANQKIDAAIATVQKLNAEYPNGKAA